jgi:MFS family permease
MAGRPVDLDGGTPHHPGRYRWVALSNTTLGVLMATLDASIVIISMPAIFRGIHLNPLAPGNISYLLWMIMGYLLVTAVLVVTLGRLGDMFGRVRIYNMGFAIFTIASIALSLDPFRGVPGALWLIVWRIVQAVGGSMLMANSAAILTDAFPASHRGMALGINQIAGIAGMFVGLLAGGLLAAWDWRAVFWVNVPIGVFGTVWAYRSLRETSSRQYGRIDWPGNITFAAGAGLLLIAITYGIQPYGGRSMGWLNPWVLGGLVAGVALLAAFCVIETKVAEPMFRMGLFKIRAFAAGNAAALLAAIARGGMQFMLIIWLQGIWLPLHGYDYERTPLWAGIYLLPLTTGFLIGFRSPVRPVRRTTVRDRRPARHRGGVHRPDADSRGLRLLAVRPAHLHGRHRAGTVRLTEHFRDHEQRTGQPARSRVRNAGDVPELGHIAVHRGVLLAHDRRPGGRAARHAHRWLACPGRPAGRGRGRCAPAAGQHPVRGVPRHQPGQQPAEALGRHADAAAPQRGRAHREGVLPASDLPAVPPRADHRLHDCNHHGACRRARVADAWRAVLLRRAARGRQHPPQGPGSADPAPLTRLR